MNISSTNELIGFNTVTIPSASDKAAANTTPQPKEQPVQPKKNDGIDVTA